MAGEQFDHLAKVTPGAANATNAGTVVSFDGSVTSFMMPNAGGPQVVNLSVSLASSVKLYVTVNSVNMPLDNDTALVANAIRTFSFIAVPNIAFSFTLGGASVINYFVVTTSRG